MEVCFCKEVILSLRQSSVKDVPPFSERFSLIGVMVKMSVVAVCAELISAVSTHRLACDGRFWWDGFHT